MQRMIRIGMAVAAAMALMIGTAQAEPLASSFTYQGVLLDGGAPVDGQVDLRFRLYDQAAGGSSVSGWLNINDIAVAQGQFVVEVDFGPGVFGSEQRWLEVQVRTSSSSWMVLGPRQKMTPTPAALYAAAAPWSGLAGMPAGFADGIDDVGGMNLPYSGSFAGNSEAVFSLSQTGLGSAAALSLSDAGNYYEGLWISHAGSGSAIKCIKPNGSFGYILDLENLASTNPLPVIRAKTLGSGAAINADGGALGYGVTANTSGPGNALQASASGTGYAGRFDGPESNGVQGAVKIISGGQEMVFDGNEIDTIGGLYLNNNNANNVLMVTGGGRVGVGRAAPGRMLHVGNIDTPNSEGMIRLQSRSGTNGSNRTWDVGVPETDADSSGIGYSFVIDDISSGGTDFMIKWGTGQVGIGTTAIPADTMLAVDGKALVDVLEIKGGSDLSEGFDVTGDDIVAGMVVVIDAERPGKLKPATVAYDRRVAGIISGAGGVRTGMIMGQSGTLAAGDHPVALTGRVYCLVDATTTAVEAGDLLTTSATPGHAMVAGDHERARGAVIGKAMTALPRGERGLVLVLVSLQ